MLKKTILTLAVLTSALWMFVLLSTVFSSCCRGIPPHFQIDSFTLELGPNRQTIYPDLLPIEGDSVFLMFNKKLSFLSQAINPLELMPTAYALSCPEYGHGGMKDPLVDWDLVCDKVYGGIPAGQSVLSMLDLKLQTKEEITQDFNFNAFEEWATIRHALTPPGHTDTLQLTLTLTFASGNTLSGSTAPFVWK